MMLIDADIVLPATPYKARNGYMVMNNKSLGKPTYVHRWIAERCLGRPLPEGALVHHVNYNKLDNRRCNLVVCPDDAYHRLLHQRTDIINAGGTVGVNKVCCDCRKLLPLEDFSTSPKLWDGRSCACRNCTNVRRRGKGYNYWGDKQRQQQRDRRARAKAAKEMKCLEL